MAEPDVTMRAVHTSAGANLPPVRYVVHATAGGRGYPAESAAGTARSTARYFTSQRSGGSAHYIHDVAGEEHTVSEDTIAWHAPPNDHSIGDEICAEATYTREQWLSAQVWPAVQLSAARCREVCDRYGIPKVKLSPADLLAGAHGICGHADVSDAWRQSQHWDPGPGFPWDRYIAEVNGTPQEDDMSMDNDPKLRAALSEIVGNTRSTNAAVAGMVVRQAALEGIVRQLAAKAGTPIDMAAVEAVVEKGVADAIAGIEATVTVKPSA